MDWSEVYRRAYLARRMDEVIAARYGEEKMRCPVHLSVGQEIPSVMASLAMKPGDHAWGTHRCHALYLAMGGDPAAMVAELYGKATGCAGGWGGSMHLVSKKHGFMGTSAVVGSSISYAVGSALHFKLGGGEQVAWAFMGDSGPETGQFWEAVSFASLHHLPIVFVLEDNLYSTQTHKRFRRPPVEMTHVLSELGLFIAKADDHDLSGVARAMEVARQRTPAMVEVDTYRFLEHVGPNHDWDLGYRSKAEVLSYEANDPLLILADAMIASHEQQRIREEVNAIVDDAFTQAERAPWPAKGW